MYSEVDDCIQKNISWTQLPPHIKHILGNSQKEYERIVITFSIKHQLRYRGNLVRHILKAEKRYYERIVAFSKDRLMLYPYHLADMVCKGLRITPFIYYISIVEKLIQLEKSYDFIPNFTAADCLRLLGIGRNEYIELMNRSRSSRGKLFGKKNVKVLLPPVPCDINIEPWWRVEVGLVLESDIKMVTPDEQKLIDLLIDFGSQTTGELDYYLVQSLYKKGLIYIDVPITAVDRVQVPPLQGFVMNRVLGDYFETLLYNIFVSIDEHITIGELAGVLQIETELVKQAVSLYCRLGFARKLDVENELTRAKKHSSWIHLPSPSNRPTIGVTPLTLDLSNPMQIMDEISTPSDTTGSDTNSPASGTLSRSGQRVAFLFDSTLTAFLMMGNLSPGLKNHAVTMFEVGKLCDDSLDSFLSELEKVSLIDAEGEGEARRYFDHAVILRSTVLALRKFQTAGLDLVRLESLHSLDSSTCTRLLKKKYKLLISMAPLSREVRPITSYSPPHLGPAVPEVNSIWFKFYLYHMTGYGPPSLLLAKGIALKQLPRMFLGFSKLLVTTWSHEPTVLNVANILHINSALEVSPVLVQAYGVLQSAESIIVPFPISHHMTDKDPVQWNKHPAIRNLEKLVDLDHSCGYLTMVKIGVRDLGCEHRDPIVKLGRGHNRHFPGTSKSRSKSTSHTTNTSPKPLPVPQVGESTAICNENFCFPEKRTKDPESPKISPEKALEEAEKLLQSPIETHFAVTPVSQSKAPSPTNGFTSHDCSDLLCQELDKLDQEQILSVQKVTLEDGNGKPTELKLDTILSLDTLMSPTEENISMFSRDLDEAKIEENKVETEDIPQQPELVEDDKEEFLEIYQGQIWTLLDCCFGVPLFDVDANTKICHSILSGGLVDPASLDILVETSRKLETSLLEFISQCQYTHGENMGILKRGRLTPQPKRNLVFDNGKVSEWSGK